MQIADFRDRNRQGYHFVNFERGLLRYAVQRITQIWTIHHLQEQKLQC